MVFLLPAWANRPKEYKNGGMVNKTPLYGMVKMANGGYTIEPGTPFYNYMKGYRSKISGAGGYF